METNEQAIVVGVVTQQESDQSRYQVRIPVNGTDKVANLFVCMNAQGRKEHTVPCDKEDAPYCAKSEFRARAWWAVSNYIRERNRAN